MGETPLFVLLLRNIPDRLLQYSDWTRGKVCLLRVLFLMDEMASPFTVMTWF
jgi:hypothetical protein